MSRFIRIDNASKDERTVFFADLLPEKLRADEGCRLIGAVDEDGIPEGMVAFGIDGFTVDILHLEVYEDLRRRGIGTALVHILLRYLALTELPFSVLASYMVGPDREGADVDAFFRSLSDFAVIGGGKYCTVTPNTVWNPASIKKLSEHKCSVKSYTELSNSEKNSLIGGLREKTKDAFLSIEESRLIPDLSLCHIENEKCRTCVIFTQTEEPDTVELSFVMSGAAEKSSLAGILHEVIRRYREHYAEYNMMIPLDNKELELFTEYLFTEGMKVSKIMTAVSFGEV